MKKIFAIYLLLPLVVLLNPGCNKDKLTEFDINYSNTLPVPAASYTADVPADYTTPQISTGSSGKFSTQKTAQELISEIKLTKFNVSVSSGNLNALKSIAIYLKASGLSDVLVASKNNIPTGSTSVAVDLVDVNIKDYIFKDQIQFRATLTMGADTSAARELKMDQTVHVKAKLSK